MIVHYFNHPAANSLIQKFLVGMPSDGIQFVEHYTALWSGGEFGEDNQPELAIDNTRRIISEIRRNLDDQLMLWAQPGVILFGDVTDIAALASGYDVMFLSGSISDQVVPDFSFQVIRRNIESLIFYSRIIILQMASDDRQFDEWATMVLQMEGGPKWQLLPKPFSCSSLANLTPSSRILGLSHRDQKTISQLCSSLSHASSIMDSFNEKSSDAETLGSCGNMSTADTIVSSGSLEWGTS